MEPRGIRLRRSYRLWKELLDFLETNPSNKRILQKFHEILDRKSAYRSATKSKSAAESLDLLITDEELITE